MLWNASLQGICDLGRDQVLAGALQTRTSRWGCIASGSSAAEIAYSTGVLPCSVTGAKLKLVTRPE